MSKKKLFNLYKYQGGFKPNPEENESIEVIKKIEVEIKKDLEKVQPLTSDIDVGVGKVRYITVDKYANYINRPKTDVYKMIREGTLESIKLKNKLHVILS